MFDSYLRQSRSTSGCFSVVEIEDCVADLSGVTLGVRQASGSQISASCIAQEALADCKPTWLSEWIHLPPGRQLMLA